ncbi:ATP-binding cassette domain-containing protein [Acidianus sulfidivorans JP7]|uniref:ABC transporter ATP-binding protein n=1 Tax=Acidianus sulfidivorans JP7 TaxID=619593 RepID=A0A2U9ILK0_9CREN|nr:ABC transporter ATP-binding protein [Acidianus sulfidivorans]AWR96880.1 ATP-binding cassette domain-containing protein [Acidianus sulfidivorans JP7]
MLLEVRNLGVEYFVDKTGIIALRDVSFNLDSGEILGIVGESGSGKTTLAKAIIRAIRPPGKIISGEVLFNGKDLLKMDYKQFKQQVLWREISYVPQASQNSLNGTMKIIDHFYDTAESHGIRDLKEVSEKAKELLRMVNLNPSVLEKYPHELSGGMKQRVLIALSLLLDPKLVIMDESVSALDVVTQKHILDNIIKLNKELNIAIMFITHEIAVAKYLTQKLVVMYGGEIMETGRTEDIISNPYNPYTLSLLQSIPSLYGDLSRLKTIKEGEISSSGCPFSNRCELSTEMCKVWKPESYHVDGRIVRCIRYANKDGKN